jgi:outer membrane protein insertion porin family
VSLDVQNILIYLGFAFGLCFPIQAVSQVPDAPGGGSGDFETFQPGPDGDTQPQDVQVSEFPEEYAGETIMKVSLSCELPVCRDPVRRDKLRALTGLYSGSTLSREAIRYAKLRLQKTGYFRDIQTSIEQTSTGINVSFVAVGSTFVRKIEFEGLDTPPFESDLRKLLIYRRGEPFRGEDSKKQTQLASLKSAYRKDGYFGTEIELDSKPVDNKPNHVDLVFDIDKGKALKICKIGLRGVNAIEYEEARRKLLSDYSFFVRRLDVSAPNFKTASYQAGKEALIQHYRQQGYFRARIVDDHVRKDFDNQCVRVLVDIKEGPRWTISFEGHSEFTEEQLREQLPFYESGYVDQEEIRRAERQLAELYETRGYPFAQVNGIQTEQQGLSRHLTFRIKERKSYEIGSINFLGNHHLSSDKLRRQMQTRKFQLFETGGYLQRQRLLDDFRKIEQAYQKEGFLYARVKKYEIKLHPDKQQLKLTVFIEEGKRIRISQLRLSGNAALTDHSILNQLKAGESKPFVPIEVRADRSRIVQAYSARGHPMAEVQTQCETLGGDAIPCELPDFHRECIISTVENIEPQCRWDPERTVKRCHRIETASECSIEAEQQLKEIRVRHSINEGPLVNVGAVFLRGNFDTDKELIHREIPLEEGDRFNVKKLLAGQSNLRDLGIFDSVSIEAIGLDDYARQSKETTAGLIVSVDESQNRYLDFRFGLEGRDVLRDSRQVLLTGEVRYTNRNLFGTARRIEPRILGAVDSVQFYDWAAYPTGSDRSRGFSDIDYLVGLELPITNPRFLKDSLGIKRLAMTVTPFYTTDLLGIINDRVLREEWGLRLDLRKELREIAERLYVSFGIEGKQAALWSPADPVVEGERLFRPRRTSGKLIPEISFDRRDSPLNPTEGYFLQLKPEIISGATLARSEEKAIRDSYLRLFWNGSLHLPVMEELILSQNLQYGQIIPFFGRSTMVSPDERFYLGGMGTVRGFPTDSLGPIGRRQQPTGGQFMLNYTFEMRYPLLSGLNLWGATFMDAGLLADCFEDENGAETATGCYQDAFQNNNPLTKVRTSAGLGIRFLIGNQIPLVLDYGVVLDRRRGEAAGNLDFNIGYTY